MGLHFSELELVSDTLETFIISGSKLAYVTSYRCPKLATLRFDTLMVGGSGKYDMVTAWGALQAGVHSLDLMSISLGYLRGATGP
jgi:hypothetical protein